MVTGKRAFEGKSQASLIGAIMERDPPPMSSLVPVTPPALDCVVKRCMTKNPEARWQSAADLTAELQWIKEGGGQAVPAKSVTTTWKRRLAFSAVGILALAATAILVWILRAPAPQPVTRTAINLPPGQHLAALDQPAIAISPDEKNIVYVAVQNNSSRDAASAGGRSMGQRDAGATYSQQLYLRPLDSNEAKPIAGTEGAAGPFFSPDSQWIGFVASGRLEKISVNGGVATTLASVPVPGGASWSSQRLLALQPGSGGLQSVFEEGGAPQTLTQVAKGEFVHRWPEFLPGGKAVLFAGSSFSVSWNNSQIEAQLIGTSELKNITQGGTQPRFAASGHLLYAQSGTLMAEPFDERKLAVTGAAVPALEGLMESMGTGAAQYSVSSTGTLIYLTGRPAESQNRLVWVSRNGEERSIPAAPRNYSYPRVSPDGQRVAVQIADQDVQIWVYDLSRDTLARLTFDGTNVIPSWSPDGRRIAYNSTRAISGKGSLFWQAADGSGEAEKLPSGEHSDVLGSFSPDGQLLSFMESSLETGRDIGVINLKDRKAQLFLRTPYEETAPKFSPDGKWLAYSSDESSQREIYVQPFPGPGGKWQISTDGGQEPVWNPKGGELYYRSGNKIMAVDVDTKSGFSAGKPRMLFEGSYLLTAASMPWYDVSPDGQRFLMLKPVESQTSAPKQINVVLNWFEELKKKVPTGK